MVISATLTIPNDDTGYTLRELLELANISLLAANQPLNAIPATYRVAGIKLQADKDETDNVYIVPTKGALAVTAHVPNNYGYIISTAGSLYSSFYEETRQGNNNLSLDEIILAADADNTLIHLWAYTV